MKEIELFHVWLDSKQSFGSLIQTHYGTLHYRFHPAADRHELAEMLRGIAGELDKVTVVSAPLRSARHS